MPNPGPLDLPKLTGKTVIVVDDNHDHLELLEAYLKACGAVSLLARDADTALAYLNNAKVDLLISDLAMPGKDGVELIKNVRASPSPWRTVPAIALTGYYEDYTHARGHGFDAFLQKPVNPDILGKIIRDFLAVR